MENYEIGQRIKNIDPDTHKHRNYGEYGTVTNIDDEYVYVEYDNGDTGKSSNPTRYYKIVERAQRTNRSASTCIGTGACTTPTNNMHKITTFIKNLTLTDSEKLLRRTGLKDDCGQYSSTAQELVLNFLTGENEAVLVEWATKFEADEKSKKS